MPSTLAIQMKIPVHRVNYALRRLLDYKLVRREESGWRVIAISAKELDERVALSAEKLGRGAARRERYASERAVYVWANHPACPFGGAPRGFSGASP